MTLQTVYMSCYHKKDSVVETSVHNVICNTYVPVCNSIYDMFMNYARGLEHVTCVHDMTRHDMTRHDKSTAAAAAVAAVAAAAAAAAAALTKKSNGIPLITIEYHSVSMVFQQDSVVLSTEV